MCNAIEKILCFDDLLESLIGSDSRRLLHLMDIFVAGDEELFGWWLEREKEAAFGTLFHEKVSTSLVNRVSPRAELFCALIRSIEIKAKVFSFSGPYLQHVASPLCMQFVDALHESATDLRNDMLASRLPSDKELQRNVNDWIELINGAHMAALILSPELEENEAASLGAEQDLARFGRSLQSLEEVLI
jgi:hypothetical protein